MSGFSNFLTNFSGGTRIRSTDSSYNDLMSKAIFIPSFNTTLYHTTDGFIYLSNLLIQFSASFPTNDLGNNNYTFLLPLDVSGSAPFIVNLSATKNSGNNAIVALKSISSNSF